jgi:hypothetical protein
MAVFLETNMDTKTLVVGQEVWMKSGPYAKKGKVVEVFFAPPGTATPPRPEGYILSPTESVEFIPGWYVEVEFLPPANANEKMGTHWDVGDVGRFFIRFDANGKTGTGWDGLGFFEPHFGSTLQSDPRTPGTKFGPWELVESIC